MPTTQPISPASHRPAATAALEWIVRSFRPGRGGSAAYATHLFWARPYPETTGYIIPTLLAEAERHPAMPLADRAVAAGYWLRSIQDPVGFWRGGLHPPRRGGRASVFNTAQILYGMVALHRHTGEDHWLDAAVRAGRWLASEVGDDGEWSGGDYRAKRMPSYYTHAAQPLLDVAIAADDTALRSAAERVLDVVVARRMPDGWFSASGFSERQPSFTHTIAYTLRGLQSAALATDQWDRFGAATVAGLERLATLARASNGELAGGFSEGWEPAGRYVCLTGNAQLAICLAEEARRVGPGSAGPLLEAAVVLVDEVIRHQRIGSKNPLLRGGIAGSAPLLGPYMKGRYPNWAPKFLCDAIALIEEVGRA